MNVLIGIACICVIIYTVVNSIVNFNRWVTDNNLRALIYEELVEVKETLRSRLPDTREQQRLLLESMAQRTEEDRPF